MSEGRVPWQDSNLALIGSDLDHKIKAAAAEGEPQWQGLGEDAGLFVWRIEQFRVVPWQNAGKFHIGDSYVVLNSYKVEDALKHDIHIWIGKESSQDEYGTAAYKMVECDEFLGGAAIQHRETQGHESPKFQSYFDNLTYWQGGVESGFRHVEATPDEPHLYRVKGTEKGMSLTQVPVSKSSLNKGDSFILFCNNELVWVWHGESANPDEKNRANTLAESMCTQGTVTVLEQGAGDEDAGDFWSHLGEGDIQEADDGDEAITEFAPVLFRLPTEGAPERVAESEPVKMRFGRPETTLDRGLLDESDVFLLDAGWEIFVWIGKDADLSEKLSAMAQADVYCKQAPRTADLPLTLVKSGWEGSDFEKFFS